MTTKTEQLAAFKGIFTALVTPMDEQKRIDFASLQRLVEHQIRQGIKGFYVNGSTGEGFLLTSEERMQVLEAAVRASDGKATIIAHIGCISTMESIRLAQHAESAGADAISAVVPFYYKVSANEIREHYLSIMDSVSLPMIIYHFPGATGVSLSADFYEELSRHPQCIGVKFTSFNLFEMEQIRAKCGPDFLIYNGHDEVYAGGALLGADGAIGSTYNMMPRLFVEMFGNVMSGRWSEISEAQSEANRVIAHMMRYDTIPYEKYILYLQGVIRCADARQPLRKLTAQEREEIESFYRGNETLRRHQYE